VVFTEHGNFGLGRSLGAHGRLKRQLQRRFFEHSVQGLAANSAHTVRRLTEIYGIPAESIVVVHNGSEFNGLVRPRDESSMEILRVVFLGRLVPFKRVDRAIEALSLVARGDRVLLEIVGGGPLEGELRNLATSLGLKDRIRFHGYRAEASDVIAGADVLVLPSEDEPFGLAVLEGCAQGSLPIVFADGGGTLEALPPDGVVVESVEELAQTLDGLIGSEELSDKARGRRAEWVREQFPISATAGQYLKLYEAVTLERG
jgi:glycosyltransferase involved in cell wall biosynthesis